MGIILPQEIEINLNNSATKRYEELGYIIPTLTVNVLDLPTHSDKLVKVKCDICNQEYVTAYCNYKKMVNNNDGRCTCGCQSLQKIEVDLNDFKQELITYYSDHKKINLRKDITKDNGFKHSDTVYSHAIREQLDMTLGEFYHQIFQTKPLRYDRLKYDKYLNNLISKLDNTKNTTRLVRKICRDNNLPSLTWFLNNCPDKHIKSFNDFIEFCGHISGSKISKESATKIIYDVQQNFKRPLIQKDFHNPDENNIGIHVITRIWGSFNGMKEELGLEIAQENMTVKHKSLEEAKQDIIDLCNEIHASENRIIINKDDFDNNDSCLSYGTYQKYFNSIGSSLREFLESIGFKLNKAGCGFTHEYADGEKVYSKYEYQLSNYLRNNNFIYNVDYFRDINYSDFIDNCDNNMNCDYEIHIGGKVLYVEVAGFLRDYDVHFKEDKEITSSYSKEKYRIHLTEKESMLRSNGLNYLILFPLTRNSNRDVIDIDKIEQYLNQCKEYKKIAL